MSSHVTGTLPVFISTLVSSSLATSTPTFIPPTLTFTSTLSPTPTKTLTPTNTPTSTVTLPPTITNTPAPTFTITPTSTPKPLSVLAKRVKEVSLAHGLNPDFNLCSQIASCQAYSSESPYIVITINSSDIVKVVIWDETHSLLNYAKPPNTTPPYDVEILWYGRFLAKIYDSFSKYFDITALAVMDGTTNFGDFSMETKYGYKVHGKLSENQKMILIITPP